MKKKPSKKEQIKNLNRQRRCNIASFSMMQRLKILLIPVLVALAAFLYFKNNPEKNKNSTININAKAYVVANFLNELPDLNRKLPHKIDDITTLNSMEYKDGKIVSQYVVNQTSLFDEGNPQSLKKMASKLAMDACRDPIRINLIHADVDFLNKYREHLGSRSFDLIIDKKICASLGFN